MQAGSKRLSVKVLRPLSGLTGALAALILSRGREARRRVLASPETKG
jgi:hypothetical protein